MNKRTSGNNRGEFFGGGRRLVFGAALFLLIVLISASSAAESGADAGRPDQAAWSAVLEAAGAQIAKGPDLTKILCSLPPEADRPPGSAAPAEFIKTFESADRETRREMKIFCRARLRELGRRRVLDPESVAALLGPEPAGVRGSEFFGIAEIPLESYQALLAYLEFAAGLVPGGAYEPSEEGRLRIDRAMRASFALSSPGIRLQYRDFDVVWSDLLEKRSCAGPEEGAEMIAGLLWLYEQVRGPAGLDWLPAPAPELSEAIEQEGGALFASARRESRSMPGSLYALTMWGCE